MSWIELKLNIPQEKMESISAYLFAQGCEGVNITEKDVIVYFSQFRWSTETKLALIDYIGEFVSPFSARDIRVVRFADQDWNKKWKEHFKPIRISNRIIVIPSWETHQGNREDIVITIDPKMAFGTGHHESTQLIMAGMEKWVEEGMDVLDAGTGSGILAILADKLGAESVTAFDNDPVALKNAFENARLNGASNKVKFYLVNPEMLQPSEYDLILANINRNVLIKYADLFADFLIKEGKLLLSGLLIKDELKILQVFNQAGFVLVQKNSMKDWLFLVLELRNKKETNENQ